MTAPLTSADGSPTWKPAHRVLFRVVFAYFVLFLCASLLDSGDGPRALAARLGGPLVNLVGHLVLRLPGSAVTGGAGWALAQEISAIVAAVVTGAVWSLAARRTEYTRLSGWLRIALRYYVGVMMMVYGGLKIIPSQFPPIALDQLDEPLGSLAPMGLLWAYMGYSSVYTMFAGFGESIGAFLLFFRRTTTAGALILVAVLSNVALINYVYDVPVKQLSTKLLIAVIVLAAADARRLIAVFFLNLPTSPANQRFAFTPRVRAVRKYVKPVIVGGATCVPIIASFFVHRFVVARSPLFGVYEVDRFTRNGAVVAHSSADSTRWRRVIFARPDMMSIRSSGDNTRLLPATLDTAQRRITASARNGGGVTTLEYELDGRDALRLRGTSDGDSVDVSLHRLDEQKLFRLLRR